MNFHRALRVLRRRGPLVLLCIVLAAGSAYIISSRQRKMYTASASLLFAYNPLPAVSLGIAPSYPTANQSQQDTNVALVNLGPGDVAGQTAQALGPHFGRAKIKAMISASPNSDTNIVTVSAKAASPLIAQRVANTYAEKFVAQQAAQAVQSINATLTQVNAQLAQMSPAARASADGLALAAKASQLEALSKLENGNVSVAGNASLPTSPSSPRVTRTAALGGLIGLLVGLALAIVLERLDRRVRDPKELEEIYGLPLLATVPERADYEVLTSLGHGQEGVAPSLYDEVFNLLRSYLRYFAVDRELRTLLVVSAGPGEGKTTVSYNLAKAAAALGSRVLLIEGDMRRGTIVGPLLGRPDPSLSDVLIGEASMEEAVRSVQIGPRGVLDVLIAGEIPPPNASELIESHAMEAVLDRASATYDLVVIDTPPLGVVADAVPLLTKVDGVIVVGRVAQSRRDSAEQLRTKLESLRAPVLGIVANAVAGPEGSAYARGYGYSYGPGYAERTRSAAPDDFAVTTNGSAAGVVRPSPSSGE